MAVWGWGPGDTPVFGDRLCGCWAGRRPAVKLLQLLPCAQMVQDAKAQGEHLWPDEPRAGRCIDGAFTRCRAVTPGGMGQVGTGMLRVETDRASLLSQLRKNTGKQVRGWHRHTGRASGGQERPGRGNDGIAPLGRGLMGLHWHFSRCGWQRVMAKVFC